MRGTFVKVLDKIAQQDKRVVCVIGDTGFSVFEDFEKKYKERFINIGIAEQNFVSFGAGLAAMGMKPFIYNVASFMTYRAFEQIQLDICYQENPVVMVGVGGGHAYGSAGPTHHSYFDLSLMTSLPNMTVLCPGDPIEMEAVMYAAYQLNRPVYIRIGRSVDQVLHREPINFEVGKGIKIKEGKRAVLLATGTMLGNAMEACRLLSEKGEEIALYSMPTVKPLDRELIMECSKTYQTVFTLEEHSVRGGLGSAVADILLENGGSLISLVRLGFPDTFAPVTGSREYLNQIYHLDPVSVMHRISQTLADMS